MVGRRQRGASMVMLVVAITIVQVAIAAALPMWSTSIRREKEEELIFRGLQYAEAIRVFQQRFGRLPVKLEELLEVEPRCIRQLWTDPMTDAADWGLIIATGPGGQGAAVGGNRPGRGDRLPQGDNQPSPQGGGPKLPTGPIQGVYSRSTDASIKLFFDRQSYDQWQFTVQLVTTPQAVGADGIPRLRTEWIGRPLRVEVPPPQALTGPGAGRPGGDPGAGRNPGRRPGAPGQPAPGPAEPPQQPGVDLGGGTGGGR